MPEKRIKSHPILDIPEDQTIEFFWKDQTIQSREGETIASALIAHGIDVFGHHPKDHSPLGLFCANGQCSQCMVLVNGKPVKSCMTKAQPGMRVLPADGLPDLSGLKATEAVISDPKEIQDILDVSVLIIGGGPAGLSAAIELGQLGVHTLLVDDKSQLGGKLVLQTHRFFGSSKAVYAGTRGIDIAKKLTDQLESLENVDLWLESTAVGIFEEKVVGIWRGDDRYMLVRPQVLLVATGARERSLPFKGNTLPGIYGAGAFQTLVNRDLVLPADQLFIVGGGNVGLIAGYHALQAGINVVGLVEALPQCGGYKVHEDKLARFGVPILTSHTILEAKGKEHVKSVIIAQVDSRFNPIEGTEKEIPCDCVLIAVGLNPVDEFFHKANEVNLPVFAAGDAGEIAEASAAMYSGKIKGLEIAKKLGVDTSEIPKEWFEFEQVLKSKPGEVLTMDKTESLIESQEVFPVMHCRQEIPCDPCASVCPNNLIRIDHHDIRSLPAFCPLDEKNCIACERCVAICPGLAITLVDFRKDTAFPTVSIPLEFSKQFISEGDKVAVTDVDGNILGEYPVTRVRSLRQFSSTLIVRVKVPAEIATQAAGLQVLAGWQSSPVVLDQYQDLTQQETIICRCEHITADEIRDLIQQGVRDINQIKAATKATMGSCGGKTCLSLIRKIFREEGVPPEEVTDPPHRPVFVEVPVSLLADHQQTDNQQTENHQEGG
jgi:NADPH-dependent 2,4-dienoyl-CoA reductase/sulfur reductase-like enzyme/bacterioferritin-associated ferredoxin/NAD-dependent dihydropyrimidine dehydrogenase PreA subunit